MMTKNENNDAADSQAATVRMQLWREDVYNRSETRTEGLAACDSTGIAWRPGACGHLSWSAVREFMH